ncbi:MAG: hypothetical protein ACXWKG_14000 [Limisphaerales bacterium]
MNVDPVSLALQNITETKHLLQMLITSSESFDYIKAKATLQLLDKKVTHLAKVQRQLQATNRASAANVRVVDFSAGA